jgi:hypothetical protein
LTVTGYEVSRWLELVSSVSPWSWHTAAVTFLVGAETLQSCGMHAFSLPDVRAEIDGNASALQELASILNVYQLAEDPLLLSGRTFSPNAETPRRTVERWPDTEYPPEHACHNPYGVWHLGPSGSKARPQQELAYVFMPTLRGILEALASKSSTPLTREQVEAARDRAACITMEHRDAQKLERSRGYADLDPEHAWEQWQVLPGR